MRDLTDVLAAGIEARAQTLDGLAPAGLDGLRARVRRRRAIRHTVEAVATLPALAAFGVVGWMLLGERDPDPAPPVVSPSPTSTPAPDPTSSPTPTSSPSSSPTPEVALGDPITEPGVPTYYAMPDGVLDDAGPGWVLATYRPETWEGYGPELEPTEDELVFLVRPDGTRFLVARIPPSPGGAADAGPPVHLLLSWEAGATTAVVREAEYMHDDGGGVVMTLDLLTGSLAEGGIDPRGPGAPNARGDMWLTHSDDEDVDLVVDSAGRRLGVLDSSTASGWCEAVAWWTADSVLAVCADHDPLTWDDGGASHLDLEPRLVTFDLGQLETGEGTVLRPLAAGDARPWGWGSANAGDGVVVAQGAVLEPGAVAGYECPTGVYLISEAGTERLPASDSHPHVELNIFESTVVDRTVYVQSTGGCSGDARPSILTSYDLDARSFTELVGPPPPPDGSADYPWLQGLTSYVVGR